MRIITGPTDVAAANPGPQATTHEATMSKSFGASSTTDDVLEGVDLSGKRVLITGVSAGLGVETARSLAAHGAHVVGAVRDVAKAKAATQRVLADAKGTGGLSLIELDLASLASVRRCAGQLLAQGDAFDLVIANAGIMACPFSKTVDGFEMQFGTNHLGHFVFVNRMASLMKHGSRLVNLSSAGHRYSDVDLDDPNFERTPYTEFGAYGRSKTANVLFAVEFDRRHKQHGIRATAVHPGGIRTELTRHMDEAFLQQRLDEVNKQNQAAGKPPFQWKTVEQGAATTVWAAAVASADEVGARYCEDCHVAELLTHAEENLASGGVRLYALDAERAKALWAKSEEMVGERF